MAVFHPGHEALHGFTVVVFLKDGGAAAGRYDHALGEEIEFLDACLSSPGEAAGAALLRRLKAEGPRPEKARLRIRKEFIARIEPFGEWLRAGAPGA